MLEQIEGFWRPCEFTRVIYHRVYHLECLSLIYCVTVCSQSLLTSETRRQMESETKLRIDVVDGTGPRAWTFGFSGELGKGSYCLPKRLGHSEPLRGLSALSCSQVNWRVFANVLAGGWGPGMGYFAQNTLLSGPACPPSSASSSSRVENSFNCYYDNFKHIEGG